MAKTALITGLTGQDGAYLAKFLLSKGYKVFGTFRRLSTPNFWRLQYLDIFDRVELIPADLIDAASLIEAIRISQPDEIYHLAAQSFVGASFEQPVGAGEITGLGVTRIVEAIREINPKIKFYQASTSELYGKGNTRPQTEDTYFRPSSPYAAAKLYGYWVTRIYREGYGIFACNGILFNHESPLRGLEFVTREQNIGAEYQKAILDPWKATPFTALTGKAVYSRLHAFPQPTDEEARKFLNDGSVDTDFLKKNGISIVYTRGEVKNPDLTKVKENIYLLKK
jgi:GDP-mannose 4,6-dehydratase